MHSLNGYKLLKRSLQNEEREVCTLKGYLLLNINPYLSIIVHHLFMILAFNTHLPTSSFLQKYCFGVATKLLSNMLNTRFLQL